MGVGSDRGSAADGAVSIPAFPMEQTIGDAGGLAVGRCALVAVFFRGFFVLDWFGSAFARGLIWFAAHGRRAED